MDPLAQKAILMRTMVQSDFASWRRRCEVILEDTILSFLGQVRLVTKGLDPHQMREIGKAFIIGAAEFWSQGASFGYFSCELDQEAREDDEND